MHLRLYDNKHKLDLNGKLMINPNFNMISESEYIYTAQSNQPKSIQSRPDLSLKRSDKNLSGQFDPN